MPVEITDWQELDAALVEQEELVLRTLLSERFPAMDWTQVLYRVLVRPYAGLHALARAEIDRLRRSQSLLAIARDPTLADDDVVNRLLSNYMTTRRTGAYGTGVLTLVFANASTFAITTQMGFEHAGVRYHPTTALTAVVTSAQVVGDQYVQLQAHPSGGWYVRVPVVADEVGAYVVVSGATFFADTNIPELVSVYAADGFIPGSAAETNEQLLQRLLLAVVPPSTASIRGISALVQQVHADVLSVVTVGSGEMEMQRNRRSLLPVAHGGYADVYVRTKRLPPTTMVVARGIVRCTREVPGDGELFTIQVEVQDPDHAGFYFAAGAHPVLVGADPATLYRDGAVFSDGFTYERAVSMPVIDGVSPLVREAADAAFSAYQGLTRVNVPVGRATMLSVNPVLVAAYDVWAEYWLLFDRRRDTGLTEQEQTRMDALASQMGTITAEFISEIPMWVWLVGMPGLYTIQQTLNSTTHRSLTDVLVRAPTACLVQLALRVGYYADKGQPDTDELAQVLAEAVNGMADATGGLRASVLLSAAQAVLRDSGYIQLPLRLRGRLLRQTGDIDILEDDSKLDIPETGGVSARTTAFYLYPEAVSIVLEAL